MPKIKNLRKEKHVTQAFMGHLIGVSGSTYSKKEAGSLEFSIMEAHTIAEFFGKSIEDIFDFEKVSKIESCCNDDTSMEA